MLSLSVFVKLNDSLSKLNTMEKGGKNVQGYLNALILPTLSHTFMLKYMSSPVQLKDAKVLQ